MLMAASGVGVTPLPRLAVTLVIVAATDAELRSLVATGLWRTLRLA
jgi:hypothetical protein